MIWKQNKHFREIVALIYITEFQKRGLPHVHCLVLLNNESKLRTPLDIDLIISAELPCIETELEAYNLVSKFMIHGLCGEFNPGSACMKDNKCSKFFQNNIKMKHQLMPMVLQSIDDVIMADTL